MPTGRDDAGEPTPRFRILVTDDSPDNLAILAATLDEPSYDLVVATSGEAALRLAGEARPDLVLLDVRMPGIDGHETCRRLKADPRMADVPVIFLSGLDRVEDRLAGFAAGGVDFIVKPFHPEEVTARVRTHLAIARLTRELSERNRDLEREIDAAHAFRADLLAAMMAPLQGESAVVQRLRRRVDRAAAGDGPVLLRGAVGDGAEAAARAIHEASSRGWRSFVKARAYVAPMRPGQPPHEHTLAERATLAEGGTIYVERLDAIDDETRAELLALLADADIRVIAQVDAAAEGSLPTDLRGWFEESVIDIPPLDERREDIPAICAWTAALEAPKIGKPVPVLGGKDLEPLMQYRWPGGIQEMESVVRRAVLLSPPGSLDVDPEIGFEGRRLGSYRLQRRLGKGGMGEVWQARHDLLPRPVAVKIVSADIVGADRRGAEQRFSREAVAIAQLQSPYTVRIHDFGSSDDGELYYAMELLDGLDLHVMVRVDGKLPVARTIHLMRQAACSLAEAHARGLVHRDVKPANLLVSHLGFEYDWVKVVDFGIVAADDPRRHEEAASGSASGDGETRAHTRLFGTPGFVAPEAITGQGGPSPAGDIYSLGCSMYWCLTGEPLFAGGTTQQLLGDHASKAPPAPSQRVDVPRALDDLVLACVAKRPQDRPTSAEVVEALDRLAHQHPWWRSDAARWWRERGYQVIESRETDPRAQTSPLVRGG